MLTNLKNLKETLNFKKHTPSNNIQQNRKPKLNQNFIERIKKIIISNITPETKPTGEKTNLLKQKGILKTFSEDIKKIKKQVKFSNIKYTRTFDINQPEEKTNNDKIEIIKNSNIQEIKNKPITNDTPEEITKKKYQM